MQWAVVDSWDRDVENFVHKWMTDNLNRDVQKWIAKCHSCQMVSPIRKDNRLPLTPIPHISTPFEDVSFDTLGSSLKATPRGNQ
jgi:hypothetical protein